MNLGPGQLLQPLKFKKKMERRKEGESKEKGGLN